MDSQGETTLAATHAALLKLAAGHGSVCLHVDVWDYPGGRRRVIWGATVFSWDGPSQSQIIASAHALETPAALLGAIEAQLADYARVQSADVQALGELPEVSQ